jgi:glycyl-tRNA synthetase beta chain
LRRAAIGVLRIVLDHSIELNLLTLLERAVRQQPLADIGARVDALAGEVYDFIIERLRTQYLERGDDSGITTEMYDAVLATRPGSLLDFDARLRALVAFTCSAAGASLAAANKRIANILRKSSTGSGGGEAAQAPDPALLRQPAEQALHRALGELRAPVTELIRQRDYASALDQLAGLRASVDQFFDAVLVNDPDQALRRNRLALLGQLRDMFAGIADLSRLPG